MNRQVSKCTNWQASRRMTNAWNFHIAVLILVQIFWRTAHFAQARLQNLCKYVRSHTFSFSLHKLQTSADNNFRQSNLTIWKTGQYSYSWKSWTDWLRNYRFSKNQNCVRQWFSKNQTCLKKKLLGVKNKRKELKNYLSLQAASLVLFDFMLIFDRKTLNLLAGLISRSN